MTNEASSHPFDILLDIERRGRSRAASAEMARPEGTSGRLALRLGNWYLMFSMDEVLEIIPPPPTTRVPGVKSWLMGIANLRGTVISVVNLKEFFGGKPSILTSSSRIVIVRSGEWHYGLLVDEVIGMRNFDAESKLPSLGTIDASLRPYLTEAFRSEDKEWLAFNAARLLNDSRFLGAAN